MLILLQKPLDDTELGVDETRSWIEYTATLKKNIKSEPLSFLKWDAGFCVR